MKLEMSYEMCRRGDVDWCEIMNGEQSIFLSKQLFSMLTLVKFPLILFNLLWSSIPNQLHYMIQLLIFHSSFSYYILLLSNY